MASGRGVHRVLGKLQKSVDEGNYYEAHQMYRTLYFRYNAQNKYTEAIDLLYNGSLTLLNANQHSSGADLAILLIDTLEKSKTEATSDLIAKVSKLHKLIDRFLPERPTYVSLAIRWSKQGDSRTGNQQLHHQFALSFWEEKNYPQARYHFIHSLDGQGCATMLVEYQTVNGYPSEVDLFLAQAVLQYLCLKNKQTAEMCFNCYTEQHPQMESGPPYVRPLINFLWLLLIAVEGGKLSVFTVLCEQYQITLQRDPTYNEYLDRIGQLFFGLPAPKAASQGLFGNLLQNLFNFEDDSDDEGASGAGARPAPVATAAEPSAVDLD